MIPGLLLIGTGVASHMHMNCLQDVVHCVKTGKTVFI